MAMFSNGIVLAQHKEPAFSRPLVSFVNPQTETLYLDRQPVRDVQFVSADEIIDIAKAAQIVDERDGRLLHRKLIRVHGSSSPVVVDAIDDEPYVSSKINPLLRLQDEMTGGLNFCQKVTLTEKNKSIIVAYKHLTDLETRIPARIGGYRVVKLRGGYPAGASISSLSGIGNGLRLTVGVGALIHLYRAITQNKRQSTVFITVAGNCIANSMNMEVSIGMTIAQVLERCGLSETPTKVVCGGPMTGIAILDPEKTLVTYATRAVLAFSQNQRDYHYSCIGCGRCQRVCPMGLSPVYIQRYVENGFYTALRRFDAHLCTGCGTCSYICPSRLNVAQSMERAKHYALTHFVKPAEPEYEEDELES